MKIRNVLITGGLGQLGYYLVQNLIQSDVENIIIVDNEQKAKYELSSSDIVLYKEDIASDKFSSQLVNIHNKYEIDTVFHLAAQISVPRSLSDPLNDAAVNIFGTLNLLDWAYNNQIENFVTIGSAAIIGQPINLPVPPIHPKNPISPYGISKTAAENYTAFFAINYGLNYKVLRPFNIYSPLIQPGDPYAGVIAKFIEQAENNKPFTVEGDGSQVRDFIYANDVAKLTIKSLDHPRQTIFNAATGVGTTVLELSQIIAEIYDIDWIVNYKSHREGDIHTSIGQKSELFDFEPTKIEVGLRKMIEHPHKKAYI